MTGIGAKLSFNIRAKSCGWRIGCHNKTSPIEWPAAPTARQMGVKAGLAVFQTTASRLKIALRRSQILSDPVISESYRGSEHALPDPKNFMVAARANVDFDKY